MGRVFLITGICFTHASPSLKSQANFDFKNVHGCSGIGSAICSLIFSKLNLKCFCFQHLDVETKR